MNDKSTQTEISISDNNVYNQSNSDLIPIIINNVTDIDMLNKNTDASYNIISNIPRPILRRYSPSSSNSIYYDNSIKHKQTLIDVINNYNELPNKNSC